MDKHFLLPFTALQNLKILQGMNKYCVSVDSLFRGEAVLIFVYF